MLTERVQHARNHTAVTAITDQTPLPRRHQGPTQMERWVSHLHFYSDISARKSVYTQIIT